MKILIDVPVDILPAKFNPLDSSHRKVLMAAFQKGRPAVKLKGTQIEEGVIKYTTGNVVDVFWVPMVVPPKEAK